jgi:hypothetical protein
MVVFVGVCACLGTVHGECKCVLRRLSVRNVYVSRHVGVAVYVWV